MLPNYCVATTRERLLKEPDLIARFLRATYAGTTDAVSKPNDAAQAALKANPMLSRTVTTRQWELMSQLLHSEETKECPHGWSSPKEWSQALATLQKYGGLEGSIDDHARFYTNQFFPCSKR